MSAPVDPPVGVTDDGSRDGEDVTVSVVSTTTFVEAVYFEPITLNPVLAYDTSSADVLQNVYEMLVFYDGESATPSCPCLPTRICFLATVAAPPTNTPIPVPAQ